METATRNASLTDLVELLEDQQSAKVDMVVPAGKIRAWRGRLIVEDVDPVLTEDGVTLANGEYTPTAVCDEGIASKLDIPLNYVRKMRASRPDLWDANVNGWLHGYEVARRDGPWSAKDRVGADTRSFLLRCFRGHEVEEGVFAPGVARAFLSDRYAVMDNLDVLTAALDGVRAAGVDVNIAGADLTDRRMTVRLEAPEIKALAPELLRGYRSPYTGDSGDENPTVFAGLQISNSETGGGAFQIVPRLVVQVCKNGMVIQKDAARAVHLGSRMDQGVVRWSQETVQKNVELVKLKTRDAVATFLDSDYMKQAIVELEEKAGKPVDDFEKTVKQIGSTLAYSEETRKGVFDHFVRGGQMTAGGLMQAATSYAQTVDDADVANDIEASATRILDLA